MSIYQNQIFEQIQALSSGEYENCTFNNCNFNENDFSNFRFIDCNFNLCNLTMITINKTIFQEVKFKDCKMLGIRFDTCSDFGLSISFESCQLNHSTFYKMKMKKTTFKNTQLVEVDFTETDLSNSIFDYCNMAGAIFNGTLLEKSDFRTSFNYTINPENNRLKKAKFSLQGITGLLNKYDILIEN